MCESFTIFDYVIDSFLFLKYHNLKAVSKVTRQSMYFERGGSESTVSGQRHIRWNIPADLSLASKGRAEIAVEQVNGALYLCHVSDILANANAPDNSENIAVREK